MVTEYITDVIDTPRLIGYVREQRFEGLTLDAILPNLVVADIEYELQNLDSTTIQVARYRAWDTAPPLGKRPGFAVVAGELAPLGMTMRMGERGLATMEIMRAGLRANGAGTEAGAPFFPYTRLPGSGRPSISSLEDLVFNDALIMTRAVQSRIEIARGDLLVDGIVTIAENGLALSADFGVPSGNKVTAATAWTDHANSVPITNMQAWLATFRSQNNGRNPLYCVTSSDVVADLTLNSQIRTLAPVTGVVPGVVTESVIDQVYTAMGFPPIVTYDTQLPNSSDTMTAVINARKFIMVGAGLGNTFYGMTPDSMQLAGQGVIAMEDAPGVVAYSQREIRPAAVYTTASAIALPVLRDPKALFVATV